MKSLVKNMVQALLPIVFIQSYVAAQPKATVVGRFRIKNPNGNYYGRSKFLLFKGSSGKSHSFLIRRKDSGYFSVRLPQGYNYIKEVHYADGGDYFKNLPDKYIELKLDSAERVYYIGDIVLTWDIEVKDESAIAQTGGGLIGYLIANGIDQKRKPEAKPIMVSTEQSTIARFAEDLEISPERIIIAPIRARQ